MLLAPEAAAAAAAHITSMCRDVSTEIALHCICRDALLRLHDIGCPCTAVGCIRIMRHLQAYACAALCGSKLLSGLVLAGFDVASCQYC